MSESNRGSVASAATSANSRWAITLYDFVGSQEQRTLTIFTGDVLKIKEVTESQWWLAECGGRAGFVPRSYVQLKDEKWAPDLGKGHKSAAASEDDKNDELDDEDLDEEDEDEDETEESMSPRGLANRKVREMVMAVGMYNFNKSDPRHVPFKKGEKFLVIPPLPGQVLDWYEAKVGDQLGFVPANRVYILKPGETDYPGTRSAGVTSVTSERSEASAAEPEPSETKRAVAIKAYRALRDVELSLTEGDALDVEPSPTSEWWKATLNGKTGLVPRNVVRVLDDNAIMQSMRYNKITGNVDSGSLSFLSQSIRYTPFVEALTALRGGLPEPSRIDKEEAAVAIPPRATGSKGSNNDSNEGSPGGMRDRDKSVSRVGPFAKSIVASARGKMRADSKVATEMSSNNASFAEGSSSAPVKKFGRVTENDMKILEHQVRFQFETDGVTLFSEGASDEACRNLYCVVEGEVAISTGKIDNFGTLSPGQIFGGDALVSDPVGPRRYTATTRGPMTILIVMPYQGHRLLCKQLNWYEDAINALVACRSGANLMRLPLFHSIDPVSLDFLGLRCALRMLKKGENVAIQPSAKAATTSVDLTTSSSSTTEEAMCVVITGSVSVSVKLAGDGTKRELRRLGPGQFCGEASLVGVWTVGQASALEPSLVFVLASEDMNLFSLVNGGAKAIVTRVSRFRTSEALWGVPFFLDVPITKREMLAASFEFSSRREGDEFYAMGQPGKCFYVVCQGEVELQGDRGEALRTLKQGMFFGERALLSANETRQETAVALGPGATVCVAISREGFERFLEFAPELRQSIRAGLEKLVGTDAFGDEGARSGIWVPTSADELACVTNISPDFMQSPEARKALETWSELGANMSPCLRSLLGYPQYMHPVPFDTGRDPLKKFIVTIVKVDDRMESIKLATSPSDTVGQLVAAVFEKFAHGTSGMALDSAGPNAFGLKVASRADYLVDRDVELGRYKCITVALRRGLDRGEIKLALVDLRLSPKSGPGLRAAAARKLQDTTGGLVNGDSAAPLMEAVALYDFEGGPGMLAFKAGDRLEVEPRQGEAMWPASIPGGGASGLVPQNIVKAVAPMAGPPVKLKQLAALPGASITRSSPGLAVASAYTVNNSFRTAAPSAGGEGDDQQQAAALLGLPPMGLEEWAKAIADGTSKCERLSPPWRDLPDEVLTATPWPLRLRIRGLDRLFSLPEIERCAYLQVRSELIFGGQVIESKLSKRMKRNAALRFDDEWFFFSKFASDLAFSTRIAFTLVGLDAVAPSRDDRKTTQLDEDDESQGIITKPSKDQVSLAETGSTLDVGKTKRPFWMRRLVGGGGGSPVVEKLPLSLTADLGADVLASSSVDIELAGTSFSIWGPDLVLKSGLVSLGMWPGKAADKVLYCMENLEAGAPRILIELDQFIVPIVYTMPPSVMPKPPSLNEPAPSANKTSMSHAPKLAELKSSAAPGTSSTRSLLNAFGRSKDKGEKEEAKQPMVPVPSSRKDNRRKSVSVFVRAGDRKVEGHVVSKEVQELLARDPLKLYKMTDHEKALIWNDREALTNNPYALTKVMLAVNWLNPSQRDQAIRLLAKWTAPPPLHAMELLDGRFGEYRLREYAVRCLEAFDDEELADFLLQLVQTLKYESLHDSPLARFLLRRALANPREIGTKLFWTLRAEMHVKRFAPRFGLLLKAYLRACGLHFAELAQQHDAQELLKSVARQAQKMNVTKAERNAFARQAMEQVNQRMPRAFQLPIDPRMRASRFNPDGCRIMSSKKRPLWLEMECVDPPECGGERMLVMFKAGDDLRQDQMTLQIFRVLENIWLAEGMNLRLTPYGCIATGDEMGMLEIVPDSETIAAIETGQGGTFGSLQSTPIRKYLELHNKGNVDQAIDNFVRSCAGYCVATYIVGLGDRHNDNILCCRDGRLFHIDFGHVLGNFKTVAALGGFKRERTPFVFTKGMAFAMGGKGSPEYNRFVDLCCSAFNFIRLHGAELVTLFRLMVPAGMPELTCDEDIQYLVDQLHLGKTDEEASRIFQTEINAAIADTYRRVDNMLHTLKHA